MGGKADAPVTIKHD